MDRSMFAPLSSAIAVSRVAAMLVCWWNWRYASNCMAALIVASTADKNGEAAENDGAAVRGHVADSRGGQFVDQHRGGTLDDDIGWSDAGRLIRHPRLR